MPTIFAMLLACFGLVAAILFIIYVMVPVFALLGKLIGRIFTFIGGELGDAVRIVGAVLTSVVFVPLALGSIVIGRWSASRHYFGAVRDEIGAAGACLYRICIGRPAWFLGLGGLTEGIEKRVPDVVARAPGADKPGRRAGGFEGYKVVGSLPPGGSGAKLYVAEPDAAKRAAFEAMGRHGIGQVIIKHFSLHDGSSLPQIVRESRALEAAKNIGLVLEHDLNEQRFFYVMPYVPGDDLSTAIRRLHEQSDGDGLSDTKLREGVGYATDLVDTLARYHRGGLWHKDVKPDNIIVHDGRAHLVDLGLVTPLRSAMTLTTHGTEYFRDPELVRMALRGVKVHQVSGEKFDVYAAGAVLYSIVENSFPAHGGLSQVRKKCPEALRWIIRRAMAEYDKRYATAGEMLDDLRALTSAPSMSGFTPADLPSMKRGDDYEPETPVDELADFEPPAPATPVAAAAVAGTPVPPAPEAAQPEARSKPRLELVNWWTGKYKAGPASPAAVVEAVASASPARAVLPLEERASAQEQLRRARERVRARRTSAAKRMRGRGVVGRAPRRKNPVGGAVMMLGLVAAIMLAGGIVVSVLTAETGPLATNGSRTQLRHSDDEFSISADSDSGLLRITEADGRTMELSFDPEMIRDAAKSWPEMAGRWRETVLTHVGEAVEAANQGTLPQPPPMPRQSERWLLIDQLGADTPDEDRRRVNAALMGAGVQWITADSDDGLELVSQATAEIGIGTPSDPKTRGRLREFLGEHHDLNGLVWLVQNDGPLAVTLSMDERTAKRMRQRLNR